MCTGKIRKNKQTRDGRGKNGGVRLAISDKTPMYQTMSKILAVDENKKELFTLIADNLIDLFKNHQKTLIVTKNELALCNQEKDISNLMPCCKEEADDRIFVHAKEQSRMGFKKLLIVTVDCDIVVIALNAYWDLDINELWVEFGKGKDRRWLPIHLYAEHFGRVICRAILFWYALTGCDTVSQFLGRGKLTAWKAWKAFPEATETFAKLAMLRDITTEDMDTIEHFIVLMYDRSCPYKNVEKCRRYLFTQLNRAIEACPPTKDALVQHVRRAMLQADVWSRCTQIEEVEVDQDNWGWYKDTTGELVPRWTTLPKASELKNCSCKKDCQSDVCSCRRFGLPCTNFCPCQGLCETSS